jgi:hypothetical protein
MSITGGHNSGVHIVTVRVAPSILAITHCHKEKRKKRKEKKQETGTKCVRELVSYQSPTATKKKEKKEGKERHKMRLGSLHQCLCFEKTLGKSSTSVSMLCRV